MTRYRSNVVPLYRRPESPIRQSVNRALGLLFLGLIAIVLAVLAEWALIQPQPNGGHMIPGLGS